MPKTVVIRNLDESVLVEISRRASEVGLSISEFLRREVERIVHRPRSREWLRRTQSRGYASRTSDVLVALDAIRGDWPVTDNPE